MPTASAFVEFRAGGLRLRGALLEARAPAAVPALWAMLPLEGQAIHDQWSGELFRVVLPRRLEPPGGDRPVAYQHPGLVVLDVEAGQLAVCYGQGRLQDGLVPLRAIPLAQLGGDPRLLRDFGHALQFQGATPAVVRAAADQSSPLAEPPSPSGRRITVTLDGARATACLLESESPRTTAALASRLPLVGQATNTHSSGPLVRFWNANGGPEGETPLDGGDEEGGQIILYPGYLYYLPTRPWRGIRIAAREATVMKGAVGGGSTRLVPVARFEGDWSAFSQAAESLASAGAKPLRFEF